VIYGMICIRNEADRYLETVLAHHVPMLDDLVVYDDCSTDDSARIAARYGRVITRSWAVPSFAEHESRFREAGWQALVEELEPRHRQDWILCFDADEFLMAPPETVRAAVVESDAAGYEAIQVRIHEIFDDSEGPKRRVDGFWGAITAPRLVRYRAGARFLDREMGCGSAPVFSGVACRSFTEQIAIWHLGYLRDEDRLAKYERYVGKPGHSRSHIESILTEPTLEPVP
jgi:glycosyltransferase involved in cell wall biosynthesis